MGKRAAEEQITQDTIFDDEEEQQEEGGLKTGFQRASAEQLAKRKIVRVKRKPAAGGQMPAASGFSFGNKPASSNPFENLKGFASSSTPVPTATASSTQKIPSQVAKASDVSFGVPATAPGAKAFSVGKSPFDGMKLGTTEKGKNNATSSYATKMGQLNDAILEWMEHQREHCPSSSWAGAMEDYIQYAVKLRKEHGEPEPLLPTVAPTTASKEKEEKEKEKEKEKSSDIRSSGEDKNKKKGDMAKDVLAFFGKRKQEKHGESTGNREGSAKKAEGGDKDKTGLGFSFGAHVPSTAGAPPLSGFSFGASASAPVKAPSDQSSSSPQERAPSETATAAASAWAAGASAPVSAGGFAPMKVPDFSKPAGEAGDKDIAGSGDKGIPGFGFGAGSKPFGVSLGAGAAPFSFGAPPAAASAAASAPAFGFGTSSTGSFGGTTAPAPAPSGAGAEGDEDAFPVDEPEKVMRNEDDKDEILFETMCTLKRYDMANKEWKESGKGTLRVTKDPDTGKQRILVRELTMGKVTLNAAFFSAMSFTKIGKNNIKFHAVVANPNPVPEDAPPGYTHKATSLETYVIKVKNDLVEDTLAKLEAGKASAA